MAQYASPKDIRELRIKIKQSPSNVFENAATGSWDQANATVIKLKAISWDGSGLAQEGIVDTTLKQRFFSEPASIPGLRNGKIKFGMYLGSANSSLLANPEANVVACFWGGIQLPTTARSATVGAGSTAVNVTLASASTYIVNGQAVLIGVRGDGRGEGRCYSVASVASGSLAIVPGTVTAPTSGDAIWFSTTCFPAENATQLSIDTLTIGAQPSAHPSNHADQLQTIAGMGTLKIGGMGMGELPTLEAEIDVGDWKYANVGDRASLSPQSASRGSTPPFERGLGFFTLGNYGSTTGQLLKAGGFSFDPGITHVPIPDPNGVNGFNGHQKVPGRPTFETIVLVDEDMPGLMDDFTQNVAKTVMLQFGTSNGKCAAIEICKGYIDAMPAHADLNNLQGVKIKIHAVDNNATNNNLQDAACRVHWF